MKDNQLDLSSKKVQEAILQSLRSKNKPAKSDDKYLWGYGLDGERIYKDNKPYSDESDFSTFKDSIQNVLSISRNKNKSTNTSEIKTPNQPIPPQNPPSDIKPEKQIASTNINNDEIKVSNGLHSPGIKQPERIPSTQESEIKPFYINDLDGSKVDNINEPLYNPTTSVTSEPPPYYFKDWLKDYLEKAPGSVKPNMRMFNNLLRNQELYNIIRMPYTFGKLQIEAFNRMRGRTGNAYNTIKSFLPKLPSNNSISEAIDSANSSSDMSLPQNQNEIIPSETTSPILQTSGIKRPDSPAEPEVQPFYVDQEVSQSNLFNRLPSKDIDPDRDSYWPAKHTPGIQMPIKANEPEQPQNLPFYVSEDKAEDNKSIPSTSSNVQSEWKPTPGAFYESGLDDITNLNRYNVYDAPEGYKWVPVANEDYKGFRWNPISNPRASTGSFLSWLTGLFSDPDDVKPTSNSQYYYRWALQETNEQRPPSINEMIQKIFRNPESSSNMQTSGIKRPDSPAEPEVQPFYVDQEATPPSNFPSNGNNELALYGAPVPMAGTLPPLSSQPMPATGRNSQVISSPEMPRRQGNAGMGTLGENANPLGSSSFKQTALYSLFASPQTNKASTNNFVF